MCDFLAESKRGQTRISSRQDRVVCGAEKGAHYYTVVLAHPRQKKHGQEMSPHIVRGGGKAPLGAIKVRQIDHRVGAPFCQNTKGASPSRDI